MSIGYLSCLLYTSPGRSKKHSRLYRTADKVLQRGRMQRIYGITKRWNTSKPCSCLLYTSREDLLIDTAQMEGYVSEDDNGITVVLDTNLSEELLEAVSYTHLRLQQRLRYHIKKLTLQIFLFFVIFFLHA